MLDRTNRRIHHKPHHRLPDRNRRQTPGDGLDGDLPITDDIAKLLRFLILTLAGCVAVIAVFGGLVRIVLAD